MRTNDKGEGLNEKREGDLYLGCFTKKQLILLSVPVGLVLLSIIIVPAVILTRPGTRAVMVDHHQKHFLFSEMTFHRQPFSLHAAKFHNKGPKYMNFNILALKQLFCIHLMD